MPNKFNPLKARMRATFSGHDLGGRLESVDNDNEVLHGVQITLEGEAKGHGVWLDREFCEAVAAAGNATGDVGLKVRYGHPSMCSDALGTELGRAKNFRVVDLERTTDDGEKVTAAGVLADVHILKAAHSAPQGDIAAHVLAVAAEDPGQFGQSIVFTYADWVVKDADGVRHSYNEEVENDDPEKRISPEAWAAQSADGKEYAVLGRLHGTDFTDTPAATDGIFAAGSLAEEASEILDAHPQIRESILSSPKNVVEFLKRSDLFDAIAGEIESARLAGLQAAKDKEIAALKSEYADLQKRSLEALADADKESVAALAERDQRIEEIKHFEADLAEKTTALDSALAEIEQLRGKVSETETALSETKAALEVEVKRYRDQVGAAMGQPEHLPTMQEGLAKCQTPEERSAFIASGKYMK